jgi:putative tryptophan/tyrosine transport system substrate-binding protein
MKRRDFIAGLAGAASWPVAARAQQLAMPVVGRLSGVSAAGTPSAAYREGLKESGFVEGQNVAFEYRFADGQYDRLPALASELVNKRVAVIATMGENAAKAAQGASGGVTPVVCRGLSGGARWAKLSLLRPRRDAQYELSACFGLQIQIGWPRISNGIPTTARNHR